MTTILTFQVMTLPLPQCLTLSVVIDRAIRPAHSATFAAQQLQGRRSVRATDQNVSTSSAQAHNKQTTKRWQSDKRRDRRIDRTPTPPIFGRWSSCPNGNDPLSKSHPAFLHKPNRGCTVLIDLEREEESQRNCKLVPTVKSVAVDVTPRLPRRHLSFEEDMMFPSGARRSASQGRTIDVLTAALRVVMDEQVPI